jgi:hypothetical protein
MHSAALIWLLSLLFSVFSICNKICIVPYVQRSRRDRKQVARRLIAQCGEPAVQLARRVDWVSIASSEHWSQRDTRTFSAPFANKTVLMRKPRRTLLA